MMPELNWSTVPPNAPGLWLRASASGAQVSRHWVTEADGKALAGLSEGFYLSWGDRLREVSTLPSFHWYGPIPSAPALSEDQCRAAF